MEVDVKIGNSSRSVKNFNGKNQQFELYSEIYREPVKFDTSNVCFPNAWSPLGT